MRISLQRSMVAGGVLAFIIAVASVGPAFANSGDDSANTSGSSAPSESKKESETRHTGTDNAATATDSPGDSQKAEDGVRRASKASAADDRASDVTRGEHRLAAAKLKVCERRQGNIKGIMTRSRERAQKQVDLFTTIATRTEAFYVAKGKTLSNYDDLVAKVQAAKATAETDLAAVPATFDCSGTNPKGAGDAFKTALKQEQADLKAYRQAVKDLIIGVKTAQGDA